MPFLLNMLLLEFCSYGRVDELVFFANLKEQHEIVVHHYIQVPLQCYAIVAINLHFFVVFMHNYHHYQQQLHTPQTFRTSL